jgi:hypothetical membrane protein
MSVKKTLGAIGTGVFFFIAAYAVIQDPAQVGNVLFPLAGLIAVLFGIKTWGGVQIQKNKGK